MSMKKFPFEDFTLVMTRDCNLRCEYCPLEHFPSFIEKKVLNSFFQNIINYNNYHIYITLFWGEPLLNKEWILFIYNFLNENSSKFNANWLTITLKIVTNWTLLNDDYLVLLDNLNQINFVDLIINLSIDGNKETQLRQRNFKIWFMDYYEKLDKIIRGLLKKDIKMELWMVMSFFNANILQDILHLLKEYKKPLFIMPVDLTYDYIKKTNDLSTGIQKYMENINKVIFWIRKLWIEKHIVNFQNDYRDIKIPPIGPTIDTNWDIYTTRDFLFTMDKSTGFEPIWRMKDGQFSEIINYFHIDRINEIEQSALRTYYGKTFTFNKSIWDFFTNLIYIEQWKD